MRLRQFSGSLLLVAVLLNTGCPRTEPPLVGSGNPVTETRTVQNFNKIEFIGAGKLNIEYGQPGEISIRTDDNLVEFFESSVGNEKLRIRTTRSITQRTPLEVTIRANELTDVRLEGAAELVFNEFPGRSLLIESSGASHIYGVGEFDRLILNLTGGGHVQLFEMPTRNVEVTLVGGGNVDVHATEYLSVKLTGAGTVRYLGNPAVAEHIEGAGQILAQETTAESPSGGVPQNATQAVGG